MTTKKTPDHTPRSHHKKPSLAELETSPINAKDIAALVRHDASAEHDASPARGCPTCGTTKAANRCDVCGHQDADT